MKNDTIEIFQYARWFVLNRLIVLAGVALCAGAAHGQTVLFSDDFEANTLGTLNGWSVISTQSPGTTIQSVGGSSTNGTGANQTVMQISDFNGSGYWIAYFKFASQSAGTLVQLTYDVQFVQPPSGLQSTALRGTMKASSGAELTYTYLNSNSGFSHYNTATSSFVPTGISSVITGDWYHVTETYDLSDQTYDWNITDLNSSAVGQSASGTSNFYQSGTTINLFALIRVSNGGITNYDNFVVTTVPEPGVAGYCLMGLAFVFAGIRSRRVRAVPKMNG